MKYVGSLIVVQDIGRSRDFYENTLKQKVKFDFGEDVVFEGDFSIHLEEHYKKLLGPEHGRITKKANDFELYFEADDIDLIFAQLKQKELEFIHETREQPWGQRVMRFYDPDFHIVEIGETMESVVLRYHRMGMNEEEISKRTSMPEEFVHRTLADGPENACGNG